MKVTFILKGEAELLPPILPRIAAFANQGITVNFVCTNMNGKNLDFLQGLGVNCYTTQHKDEFLGRHNKIFDWSNFKAKIKDLLNGELKDSDYLYICSADTALSLGGLLSNKKYVLQSNELYDSIPMYKKGLKKYMQNAKIVVVPEYCRANICAYWYGLKELPTVIPNIPYLESEERDQTISDAYADCVVRGIKDKKILLYQGHISSGDRSLKVIAEALKLINDPSFALLLMGVDHDGSTCQLQEIYTQTYYIPFVPAPKHLQVTSHAYIGLLSYDRVSMNNIFCAPNKIYEYSSLAVPMLGNNIPGLKYTVEHEKIGACADYENVDSVVSKILEIDRDHEIYSRNAKEFYNASGLDSLIGGLISRLQQREGK